MQIGHEVITLGNVHWVGLLLWAFVMISLFCLVLGMIKKSGWLMLLSAVTVFPMAFYLFGAENWLRFAILVPIVVALFGVVFCVRGNGRKGFES